MLTGYIYGYYLQHDQFQREGVWLYVGQTVNVEKRHQGHLNLRLSGSQFERLLGILSWVGMTPIVLETVEGTDLEDLRFNLRFQETVWMFKLKTLDPIFGRGWNFGIPFKSYRLGMNQRPEARAKIGAANATRSNSFETRQKISVAMSGRKLSVETRTKMSTSKRKTKYDAFDGLGLA